LEGGNGVKESAVIAKILEEAGVAAIHASSGNYETLERAHDSMPHQEGWKLYMTEGLKAAITIPVIAVGGLKNPSFCEKILAERKADFIALGRTLLADPQWPNKAREGRVDDIRKCISCNECTDHVFRTQTRCAINPAMGRGKDFYSLKPADVREKVMVVGGGPAGMEAARVAALRGHEVALYEKNAELGGQIKVAATPPSKDKVLWLLEYLSGQMGKLGIKVELQTEVTPDLVERVNPDAVIIATGGRLKRPNLPGMEKNRVVPAWDVLAGEVEITGEKVAVLGGWMVGCETADFLAERSNKVTIVARSAQPAPNMELLNRVILMRRLKELNVAMLMEHDVVEVTEKGLILVDKRTGENRELEADFVVFARGAVPRSDLLEALEGKVAELYAAGGCRKVGKFMQATYEGATTAMRL
ncbi:MAG: FAD-dependent oxidoreductase, partial [Chloroflexi bacterium]|nr:FAD-dependent oxidoreductase [Chloroflexota bacterium]